jgi:hypothetical protein
VFVARCGLGCRVVGSVVVGAVVRVLGVAVLLFLLVFLLVLWLLFLLVILLIVRLVALVFCGVIDCLARPFLLGGRPILGRIRLRPLPFGLRRIGLVLRRNLLARICRTIVRTLSSGSARLRLHILSEGYVERLEGEEGGQEAREEPATECLRGFVCASTHTLRCPWELPALVLLCE